MRLLQIAKLGQIGQLVADRGGADAAHLLGDGLGPHWLRRVDICLYYDLEYLLFPLCEFHMASLFPSGLLALDLALSFPEC